MLKDGTYYRKLEGTELSPGTRSIAERIQKALPYVPDHVALTAALALTAEAVVGTSPLHALRGAMPGVDDTLDQVTQNFVVTIQIAATEAGLSHEQLKALLKAAERATIDDMREFQALALANRGDNGSAQAALN